ncbi:hypothetical protein NEOLEDRAFT_1029388, partial [Neolentinus lepideus HHB14362 ss-1]
PMHTSVPTGQMWLDELINGHEDRFHRSMGMRLHVFQVLSQELQLGSGLCDTKYVTADEPLAIFCY